jgi:hypothetical protein
MMLGRKPTREETIEVVEEFTPCWSEERGPRHAPEPKTVAADVMTITPQHIEAAADYLMRCSALGGRDGILFETFVEGDAWYDQGPLAVSFGLPSRYDEDLNTVFSFLGLIFNLAADHAARAGLGRIEGRGGRSYFVLTTEGRKKYPTPRDEDIPFGEES